MAPTTDGARDGKAKPLSCPLTVKERENQVRLTSHKESKFTSWMTISQSVGGKANSAITKAPHPNSSGAR